MKIAYLLPKTTQGFIQYFLKFITPNGDLRWDEAEFFVNPKEGEFDALVVHQSFLELDREHRLICPPTKTLMVVKEPPSICFFPSGYTQQFHGVISQDTRIACNQNMQSHSAHHWFVEVSYKEAEQAQIFQKTKLISAVVSAKQDTVGHRKRFRMMEKLKQHFGDDLDWWGRGVQELTDPKITALRNYKYHIALENGNWPHYWTEKLADCYISNCVPIYWGPDNVTDYFDPKSLIKIDVDNPDAAIQAIESAIKTDLHSQVQREIAEARKKILTEYHPYAVYMNTLKSFPKSQPTEVIIKPQSSFSFSIQDKMKNWLWRQQNKRYLV